MELIDRYLKQVMRDLPAKSRADIGAEIRSVLEDMVQDRSEELGREPDEEMVLAVLQAYGPPAEVAASYLPERYLVGPKLYPIFMLVVKIVLAVMAGFFLFSLILAFVRTGRTVADLGQVLTELLPNLYTTLATSLGSVVIVFVILERLQLDFGVEVKAWDPRDLPLLDESEPVRPVETALKIVGLIVLLAMVNFFPHWVGALNVEGGRAQFVPLLSADFAGYLPWLNLRWALGILFYLLLLRLGHWERWTRWVGIALHGLDLVIVVALLVGPSVIGLNPDYLALHDLGNASLGLYRHTLLPLVDASFRLALGVALIVALVEFLKLVLRTVQRSPFGDWPLSGQDAR